MRASSPRSCWRSPRRRPSASRRRRTPGAVAAAPQERTATALFDAEGEARAGGEPEDAEAGEPRDPADAGEQHDVIEASEPDDGIEEGEPQALSAGALTAIRGADTGRRAGRSAGREPDAEGEDYPDPDADPAPIRDVPHPAARRLPPAGLPH